MFSVPFNSYFYNNYWNVKLYSGYKKADIKMAKDLYNRGSNKIQGDNSWYGRDLG